MATLDELIARFPDNDVGAIDADDMRATVAALWEYTATVQASLNQVVVEGVNVASDRIDALEARTHAGHVDFTGTLVSGSPGWTAVRDETGLYTVTHDLGVDPERYAVTVTPMILPTQQPVTAGITATTATSFTYRLTNTVTGENVNHDANFTGQVTG